MALPNMSIVFDATRSAVNNAGNVLRSREQANQFYGMDLEMLSHMAAIQGSNMMMSAAREANETNIKLAQDAQRFNAEQAQKQMDFQERMSNTAHQREMKDLIAAGLNPILTATGGNGASSPSGSSANAVSARVDPTVKFNPYENLVSDTLSARRFKEIEKKSLKLNERQLDLSLREVEIAEKKLQMEGVLLNDTLLNNASARGLNAANIGRLSALNALTGEQIKAQEMANLLYPLYETGGTLLNSLIGSLTDKVNNGSLFSELSGALEGGKDLLHEIAVKLGILDDGFGGGKAGRYHYGADKTAQSVVKRHKYNYQNENDRP